MSSKTKTTATKQEAKSALVPKLRFPEFREGWREMTFGALLDDIIDFRGRTPVKLGMAWGDGNITSLSANNVKNGFIDYNAECNLGSEELYQRWMGDVSLEKNDIVFTMEAPLGNALLLPDSRKYILSQRVVAFKTNSQVVNPFLVQLIWSEGFQDAISELSTGSTAKGINQKALKTVSVKLPHPKEQQKIAECLSSVDELMAAQVRKVDALKTHKKGLMQQLFPREGETQPRLRFPEFQNAGEWVESPLSKFILTLDSGVSVNSGDGRPADKTEFGVLKTSAITKGQFDPEENKVVLAKDELSRLREPVTGGTIIMCRKNTPALVGSNAYVESSHENLFLPDLLWAAKPREGVSMRFLAFILGSDKGRAALSKLATGSSASMSNITKPEVLAFSVMAPSPAEQQRIASCLSSLDVLITSETQKHEALKTHKKGLMQQLFPSLGNH